MTDHGDPWEGEYTPRHGAGGTRRDDSGEQPAVRPEGIPAPSGGGPRRPDLLSGPNLPYLGAIVVAVVAVAVFLYLEGTDKFFGDGAGGNAAGATTTTILQPDDGGTTTSTAAQTTQATSPPDASSPLQGLSTEPITNALAFPVFVTSPPGDDRLFVVERPGTISIVDPDIGLLDEPFLDIRDRVDDATGIELGLLGLAFHPDYASNGRFFVYYTDNSQDPRLVEMAVSDDPNRADPAETLLLTYAKDTLRHNAGMLQFGPDGYLWAAVGDGATGGEFAQDTDDVRGSILRIDVDSGDPYGIPPDNPFVDGGAPEIYAYGLRNPWRFSLDPVDSMLYIGDVGQARYEEIDVMPMGGAGTNFGWPVTEGEACWIPETGCDSSGVTFPELLYDHTPPNCSVTGGYVYRGSAIPELWGHYFYADWCAQWIRTFRYEAGEVTEEQDWADDIGPVGSITSFGVDDDGEMYITTSEGLLAKIVPVR